MGITSSSQIDNKFFGFRLYKIFENGPLAESNLTILDNFIIPPEDVLSNRISFTEYIKKNINKKINLQIYSVIKRFLYTIEVTPRNDWGDQKSGFLGACVRYENWSTAHTNILRVIKVKENSVSDKILKLIPFEDYIISIRPDDKDFITLNKEASDPLTIFQEVLQDNISNIIEIFIYNIKTGPRSVKFFLEQKNGEVLGCDVAYGKLHELPMIHNEETDKHLVYKHTDESDKENKNEIRNDFVFEETKKILVENLNRNKSNSSENVKKIKDKVLPDKDNDKAYECITTNTQEINDPSIKENENKNEVKFFDNKNREDEKNEPVESEPGNIIEKDNKEILDDNTNDKSKTEELQTIDEKVDNETAEQIVKEKTNSNNDDIDKSKENNNINVEKINIKNDDVEISNLKE